MSVVRIAGVCLDGSSRLVDATKDVLKVGDDVLSAGVKDRAAAINGCYSTDPFIGSCKVYCGNGCTGPEGTGCNNKLITVQPRFSVTISSYGRPVIILEQPVSKGDILWLVCGAAFPVDYEGTHYGNNLLINNNMDINFKHPIAGDGTIVLFTLRPDLESGSPAWFINGSEEADDANTTFEPSIDTATGQYSIVVVASKDIASGETLLTNKSLYCGPRVHERFTLKSKLQRNGKEYRGLRCMHPDHSMKGKSTNCVFSGCYTCSVFVCSDHWDSHVTDPPPKKVKQEVPFKDSASFSTVPDSLKK